MNEKQFELHMEMLDRIRCGLIDVEGEVAALKAEVASLRINQQAQGKICPTCMGRGEYLSDDFGTGIVKCGLCRATGKLSPVR